MTYPLRRGDSAPSSLAWLLSVTVAGRVLRWASRPLELLDADSASVVYDGGLEVDYGESWDLLGADVSDPSVAVRGLELPDDVDLGALIEDGHALSGAACELAQWVTGRTYEQRLIRFIGEATIPDYGPPGEPLSLTIRARGTRTGRSYPPAGAVATSTTWTTDLEEEADGVVYPTVIGRPGFALGARVTGTNGGSPAYVVDGTNRYLLIAGHPVVATSVQVIDVTDLEAGAHAVTTRADALGRRVATVTLNAGGGGVVDFEVGEEYWIRWDTGNGGLQSPYGTGDLRGAGDVIRWALGLAGADVDGAAFASVADALNAYKIDTYIDEPVDLWAWVTDHILPLLPCALVMGPGGIRPVLWSTSPIAAIDVQRDGLVRRGPVRIEDEHLANEITIRFAPRSDGGDPYRSSTRTGRDVGADDPDVQPDSRLRASVQDHGLRVGDSYESAVIYDPATAGLWLAWQAAARAQPWRTIEYEDPDGTWAHLSVGDCLTLTDSDLGVSSRTVWLSHVEWQDTLPTYTLTMIRTT